VSSFQPYQTTVTFSVPTTASTTTYGTPFSIQWPYDALVVIATLKAGSASTLNIYIQESWDGGTTWTDVAAYKQIAAAGTATYRLVTSHIGASSGTTEVFGAPAAVTSGTVSSAVPSLVGPTGSNGVALDGPWGTLTRIVSTTGTGTNSAAVTQTFLFIPWQRSH
jgi:hypothetical protein